MHCGGGRSALKVGDRLFFWASILPVLKVRDKSFGATPGFTPYLAENRHFQTENSQYPFDENTSKFSIS